MSMILCKWEKLIALLNPSNPNAACLSEECVRSLIIESEAEQEKVSDLIIEGILNRSEITDKRQYVQIIQGILTRLMDKLHRYKQETALNENGLSLYNTVSEHLKNTLNFIEDFFGSYFDRNERIPVACLETYIKELCKQSQLLQQTLEPFTAIDSDLKKILLANFRKFFAEKMPGATYNELVYQKDLIVIVNT